MSNGCVPPGECEGQSVRTLWAESHDGDRPPSPAPDPPLSKSRGGVAGGEGSVPATDHRPGWSLEATGIGPGGRGRQVGKCRAARAAQGLWAAQVAQRGTSPPGFSPRRGAQGSSGRLFLLSGI